jgi:microcystin-dependent protein
MILAWSGSLSDIPTGWALCNGSNGTPNLSGRFILGISGAHPIGQIGGEESHRLTIAEMPSHNHNVNMGLYPEQVPNDIYDWNFMPSPYISTSTNFVGGDQPHNIMPPYYVLAYIMRII